MSAGPRIALIHATPVAVEPIRQAFSDGWPDAETVNLMDDSLSADRSRAAHLTEALTERIAALARYAKNIGSDGILFTCSAFGQAIEAAADTLDIPVLKPNQAMFQAAIERGRNVAMVATFAPARAGLEQEFQEDAARIDPEAHLTTFVVEHAMTALRAGDAETHNKLVAEEAAKLSGYDAIMLAHFSTSRAAATVRELVNIPVITSPDTAVAEMRRRFDANRN